MKTFSFQKTGIYKESDQSHTLAMRDYKDATDLIIQEKHDVQLHNGKLYENRGGVEVGNDYGKRL